MNRKQRYQAIIDHFAIHMPNPTTELQFQSPFQLLIAVILSAQCTDKRVNEVTPALFRDFPTAQALSHATEKQIFNYIRRISYPQSKTKYLLKTATLLYKKFNEKIPDNRADLESLPGVGRKTANVILSAVHQKPTFAVDTHVMRVAKRLQLIHQKTTTPLAIERMLTAYFPQETLSKAHHWLVLHGRYTCTARKPKCSQCPFVTWCPSSTLHKSPLKPSSNK